MSNLETAILNFKIQIQEARIISMPFTLNAGRTITFFVDTSNKELLNRYKKMLIKYAKKIKANVAISTRGNYILFLFPDKGIATKVRGALI